MKKTTKSGYKRAVLLAVVMVLSIIPFLKTESVDAASCSHTWVTETTKQPTCGSAGTYVTKCSKCGAGNPNGNGPIPATGKHNWSLTSTTKATCTANGSKNYTCTVCKQTKKETITKLGHSFSQVTTKQPTCGTAGTYETKCSRCGTGSSNGNGTIPATGKHNWSLTSTTNATCTANGSKNYTCTVCKQTKKETINKLGHAYSQVTTKQPTCGAAGTYVTKCSRCGAGSSNGNGSIPATGKHTWDRTAATCTAAKKCTICGAIGEAAKGHNWDRSAATCTEAKKCKTCGTVGQAAKGHTWNISSATCTTDKKCTVCGTISQKALGHSFAQVTTKQPTCGVAGTYETKCSRCGTGSPNGNGTIAPTGKHNFVYTSTTNATCTADGYKLYTCSVCKQTKKETITKLGHSFSQVTTKQPTCGVAGTYETKCSRCGTGSPNGNGTIAPTGKHNFVYTSTTNATCTADGYKLYTCSVCKQTKKETITKLGHSFSQVTTKQPTCGTAGTYETKCSRCGTGSANGNGTIAATGKHNFVYTSTTNATCTVDGYKLYTCSVCKQTKKETIAKLGHSFSQVTTKQPTCGTAGTYETKCSRCGTGSANGNGTIAATGKHNFVYTSTTNPTCTADGYKLYTCSVCKQTKKETITKLGHSYSQVTTKQPTCGTAGTYETKCSRCGTGSSTGNGTIAPTGNHKWEYTSTTNATCTADGYKLYTCSVCKQTKKETITKLGHSYSQVTTKQPTCGTAGTYETKCSRCGTGSSTGNGTIAPTGNHKWEYTSTTNATCTADGYKLYTCSVCKQTKKETITKLGHSFSQVTTKEPTCGAAGTYETKCSRCGTGSPNGNGTIAPTGLHTWVYTSTTEPTCTKDGYKLYTCSGCKQTKKETLITPGHSFTQVITKQPSCGTAGTYETKCSRCGTGSPNGNGTIAPTGLHTWVYTSTTEPTCTKDGYKLYTCSGCKQTKKETLITPGHSFTQVITKQPSCGTAGTYETKCSRCGTGSANGNGYIPATEKHTWNVDEPTCSTERKCTECGKVDKPFLAHTCTWITVPAGSGYGKMEYVCSVCNKTTAELFISGLSTGAKPSAYIKVKADTPAVNKFLLPSFGIPVNYQLLGYSTQANATKKEYTTGTTVSIPADGKLYAVVVPREYTVVYHEIPYSSDGTESEVHTADVDFSIKYDYLDDEPFRWFRGWAKTKNASEPTFCYDKSYDYKLIISAQDLSDSNPNNNTVHLYPVWGDKKFTVRYEWLTGCQDVVHDSVNDYLTKGEFVPPATINNCRFIGWRTNSAPEYVFSDKNTIAEVLPLMANDDNTLHAVYGDPGDAPAYILDSQYENPVWIDGTNISVFIRIEDIDELLREVSAAKGRDDLSDKTFAEECPLLAKVRNAIYLKSSGYKLSEVCTELETLRNRIEQENYLYLEIRMLNNFDGVNLFFIEENYVVPRHADGNWCDLNSFAAVTVVFDANRTSGSGTGTVADVVVPIILDADRFSGSVSASIEDIEVRRDQKVSLRANEYTYMYSSGTPVSSSPYYNIVSEVFVGWNTKKDGSGKMYAEKNDIPVKTLLENYPLKDGATIPLYAIWRPSEPITKDQGYTYEVTTWIMPSSEHTYDLELDPALGGARGAYKFNLESSGALYCSVENGGYVVTGPSYYGLNEIIIQNYGEEAVKYTIRLYNDVYEYTPPADTSVVWRSAPQIISDEDTPCSRVLEVWVCQKDLENFMNALAIKNSEEVCIDDIKRAKDEAMNQAGEKGRDIVFDVLGDVVDGVVKKLTEEAIKEICLPVSVLDFAFSLLEANTISTEEHRSPYNVTNYIQNRVQPSSVGNAECNQRLIAIPGRTNPAECELFTIPYGVHFTLIYMEEIYGHSRVDVITPERNDYLDYWDGQTIRLRPGSAGEFITEFEGKDAYLVALGMLNGHPFVKGAEDYPIGKSLFFNYETFNAVP